MKRLWLGALALTLGLGIEGCDRCAGIAGCTGDARLSLAGQLIVRETGAAVAGAAVDFVRTGGVELGRDSVSTTTGSDGRFQLAVDAADIGEVVGDLQVRPPSPWNPYRVRGVHYRTAAIRGEGEILGRLVVVPYVEFIGLVYNRIGNVPLVGAHVTITRVGGVAFAPDRLDLTVDQAGRIYFQGNAGDVGEVLADVSVEGGGLRRPGRLSSVSFWPSYLDRLPEVAAAWRFGLVLPYLGEVYHRGSRAHAAGIAVEFRRTSGIPITPDAFTVYTDANGRFNLGVAQPDAEGEVVGTLVVRPPAPAVPETILAQRMRTQETDSLILLGVWGFGEQVLYAGEVYRRGVGAPASGIDVAFRRTGGIAIAPESFTTRTDAAGRFPIAPATSETGELVGDLVVRVNAATAPDTIVGVRLATFRGDVMRFAGRWGVGASLQYVGELLRSDTLAPIVDAVVEFRWTGGIPVTPSVVTTRTNAAGRFPFELVAEATGEVVGDLVVRPPAPFRDTTITGIRLRTFATDEVRLGGVWRLVPPTR